jgi:hypothetical protein
MNRIVYIRHVAIEKETDGIVVLQMKSGTLAEGDTIEIAMSIDLFNTIVAHVPQVMDCGAPCIISKEQLIDSSENSGVGYI